jgi:hypothetical protein
LEKEGKNSERWEKEKLTGKNILKKERNIKYDMTVKGRNMKTKKRKR